MALNPMRLKGLALVARRLAKGVLGPKIPREQSLLGVRVPPPALVGLRIFARPRDSHPHAPRLSSARRSLPARLPRHGRVPRSRSVPAPGIGFDSATACGLTGPRHCVNGVTRAPAVEVAEEDRLRIR